MTRLALLALLAFACLSTSAQASQRRLFQEATTTAAEALPACLLSNATTLDFAAVKTQCGVWDGAQGVERGRIPSSLLRDKSSPPALAGFCSADQPRVLRRLLMRPVLQLCACHASSRHVQRHQVRRASVCAWGPGPHGGEGAFKRFRLNCLPPPESMRVPTLVGMALSVGRRLVLLMPAQP